MKEINHFLKEQNKIRKQYQLKAKETQAKSRIFFGAKLLKPLKLCNATILHLIYSVADTHLIKTKIDIQKMHIATAYLQSIDVSTNLIMEGNYIKATATLKQDYEIMIRLNEIHKGRAKKGKTPNPQNGPETYREIYGFLNNISHPSREDALNPILNYKTNDNSRNISFVKQLQKGIAHRLLTYDAAIKLEILRHILKLYYDIVGEDENHKKCTSYYFVIHNLYVKEGMFATSSGS